MSKEAINTALGIDDALRMSLWCVDRVADLAPTADQDDALPMTTYLAAAEVYRKIAETIKNTR